MIIDAQAGGNNPIQNGSLTYSRSGYYTQAIVIGDRQEVETTLFTDVSGLDNIELKPMWEGEATEAQKTTDGDTADTYVKYATGHSDVILQDVDCFSSSESAIKAYRQMKPYLQNYDGELGNESAFAMLEVSSDTWESTGKNGLGVRIADENISYIKFQGADKKKEYAHRQKNKCVTCTIKGYTRPMAGASKEGAGYDYIIDGEYTPLRVFKEDRFKTKKAFNSYRVNPVTSTTTLTIRDDIEDLKAFAIDTAINNSVPSVDGTLSIIGRRYWTVGEKIDSVQTDYGTINVGLNAISIDISYPPPVEGQQSGSDITTIELGRK